MRMIRSILNLRLLSAAASGNLSKVIEAIKKGADINFRKDGWTAWMKAYANCHAEIVKFLESEGAVVTETDLMTAGIAARMNQAIGTLRPSTHHIRHHMKLARN